MLPTFPKIIVKGDRVGVCKTTSGEYETPDTHYKPGSGYFLPIRTCLARG
jgi:hypothetical protein